MTKHKTKIGRIFKKKHLLADGTYRDHSKWTVRYKGKDYASGETEARKAEKFLLKLASNLAEGKGEPKPDGAAEVVLMKRVFDDLETNAKRKGNKTARDRAMSVDKRLRPFFDHVDAATLTTEIIDEFVDDLRDNGLTIATINTYLRMLKRALNLAVKRTPPLIVRFPPIELLKGEKVRRGFLSAADYYRLKAVLTPRLVPLLVAGYHVGNRRGELTQVELHDIEMDATPPQFRLYPDATKTGQGRVIPIYGEMLTVFREQIAATRREFPKCTWLFHDENGERIRTFYKAWKSATAAAGVGDLLFHDLRRAAVRNLIRSGVPRSVAMKITGHETEHVFERYNITDERDLNEAAQKMALFLSEEKARVEASPTDRW